MNGPLAISSNKLRGGRNPRLTNLEGDNVTCYSSLQCDGSYCCIFQDNFHSLTQTYHQRHTTILVFLLGLTATGLVQGLDIYEICPTRRVVVSTPNANAVIRHQPSDSATPCTLTLAGLSPGGYMAIKGASKGISGRTCTAILLVGGEEYCYAGDKVDEPANKINQNGELEFMITSNASAFDMTLITNCEYGAVRAKQEKVHVA